MLLSGSNIGGQITKAASGFEGKVLITGGVKFFSMPYGRFFNVSY
jgi:hypothetical protein